MGTPLPPGALATTTSASSTFTQAVATAAASVLASSGDKPGASNGKCELLGPFAILVQAALGGLALLSLVYKRWRERPQRPIKVWAFDVSKQVVGSILLHMANLLLSMISSGDLHSGPSGYTANPCSFYLLNLAIDTTLGIPILILFLKVITVGLSKTPFGEPSKSIESGNYGNPPKVTWWVKQSFIYFLGLLGMKLVVFFLLRILPWIVYVGDWALKWTEGNEQLQIFFVMLFFPLVMNALQYYIIDGFIKNKKPSEHYSIPQDDQDDDEAPGPLRNAWDASFDSEEEVEGLKRPIRAKTEQVSSKKGSKKRRRDEDSQEYDPDQDGENSSGQRSRDERGNSERRSLLEQVPPE